MTPERIRPLLVVLACALATASILALGINLLGVSPWTALRVWAQGAMGNPLHLATSLVDAGPLILTGLSTAVAFRAGVLNIGAEGQYLVGAMTTVGLCTTWRLPMPALLQLTLAIVGGVVAGAVYGAVAAGLERWRRVPVVLSTILMNFIAAEVVAMVIEGPLRDPAMSGPQTALIPTALQLPSVIPGTQIHAGILIAVLMGPALWLFTRRHRFGFETEVCGRNPWAATLAGVPVASRRFQILVLSGAIAGLGGALQMTGLSFSMSSDSVHDGYGYAGIAVALLGRLHPIGVVAAAIFFGMLGSGARNLEKELSISHDVADVAKGLIVLAVLAGAVLVQRSGRCRPAGTSSGSPTSPTPLGMSAADDADPAADPAGTVG